MRAAIIGCFLIGSIQLAIAQTGVSYRWTLGFAMGTLEAIIRNKTGSEFNIYCPSGQIDTTPGFFYNPKQKKFRAQQNVTVQIVVDGENYPFYSSEGNFKAQTRIGRETFRSLVTALARSRADTFSIELPDLGFKESFSLKDAYKTVGGQKNSTVIDDCLKS